MTHDDILYLQEFLAVCKNLPQEQVRYTLAFVFQGSTKMHFRLMKALQSMT